MCTKILITGGAGFIGTNLSLRLVDRGYCVTVLDNLSPQVHGPKEGTIGYKAIENKVRFLLGDVRDKLILERVLADQDAVVHLAAETGTGQSMYEIHEYADVNVAGTANLLEVVVKNKLKLKKMILASSRAVYGEGRYICPLDGQVFPNARSKDDMDRGDFGAKCPVCGSEVEPLPTGETSAIKTSSIYAVTKYAQEQMVSVVSKSLDIPTVILRYQNVYGPGQSLTNPYTGILSIFSNLLRDNAPIDIFEDGSESRDFVYIDDVVEATMLALESKTEACEIFNVGSGEGKTVKEVAELLKRLFESNSTLQISGRFRLGDIRHNYADISKATSGLNFAPKVSFEEGLKEFVAWVKKQEVLPSSYESSLKEMVKIGLLKSGTGVTRAII
jgi:dTDP-L-rhamnose 4-epimerase